MSQEVEIERKNLLTAEEFERLKAAFSIEEKDFALQTNHYFDTPQFELKNKHSALRIREKGTKMTLTLKQPHPSGILETHQALSESQVREALSSGTVPNGEVKKQLLNMNVSLDTFIYLGALSTARAEKKYHNSIVVLDKSFYFDVTDYELELESPSVEEADSLFKEILITYQIQIRPTKNKIERFFEKKIEVEVDKDS